MYVCLQCIQECKDNYDEEFASRFEKFLGEDPTASLASANNNSIPDDDFLAYIKGHLQAMKCPSLCSRLWLVDYPAVDNVLFVFL